MKIENENFAYKIDEVEEAISKAYRDNKSMDLINNKMIQKNINEIRKNPPFGDPSIAEALVKLIESKNKSEAQEAVSLLEDLIKGSEEAIIYSDEDTPSYGQEESPEDAMKSMFSLLKKRFEQSIPEDEFKQNFSNLIPLIRSEKVEDFRKWAGEITYQFSHNMTNAIKRAALVPEKAKEMTEEINQLFSKEEYYPYKTKVKTEVVEKAIEAVISGNFSEEDKEKAVANVSNFFKNKSVGDIVTIRHLMFKNYMHFSIEDLIEAAGEGSTEWESLLIPEASEISLQDLLTGDVMMKEDGTVFKVEENNPNTSSAQVTVYKDLLSYFSDNGVQKSSKYQKGGKTTELFPIRKSSVKARKLSELKKGDEFSVNFNDESLNQGDYTVIDKREEQESSIFRVGTKDEIGELTLPKGEDYLVHQVVRS